LQDLTLSLRSAGISARGAVPPPERRHRARAPNVHPNPETAMQERTYTTAPDGATSAATPYRAVRDIKCRLKKLTTTDEGAVALSIEIQIHDDDELEQIRDLIRVQQGELELSLTGRQGELFS
jgi:hypothetical protein